MGSEIGPWPTTSGCLPFFPVTSTSTGPRHPRSTTACWNSTCPATTSGCAPPPTTSRHNLVITRASPMTVKTELSGWPTTASAVWWNTTWRTGRGAETARCSRTLHRLPQRGNAARRVRWFAGSRSKATPSTCVAKRTATTTTVTRSKRGPSAGPRPRWCPSLVSERSPALATASSGTEPALSRWTAAIRPGAARPFTTASSARAGPTRPSLHPAPRRGMAP